MYKAIIASVCIALLAAGCVSSGPRLTASNASSFVDGNWTFGDGQFRARFRGGAFNSVFLQTNEQVSAGEYTVTGNRVNLRWVSFRDRSERNATCRLSTATQLTCTQSTGQSFVMTKA